MFLLTGCGAGESTDGNAGSHDRAGAEAAAQQGRLALEATLNEPPLTLPEGYDDASAIALLFQRAHRADPTYEEGAFWSAAFTLVEFLESDPARAFLAKLGWQNLHGVDSEFGDLAERFGQSFGEGYDGVMGPPVVDPNAPPALPVMPLPLFGLPNDPDDSRDVNQCVELQVVTEGCTDSLVEWQPRQVYLFGRDPGTEGTSFISFQELYDLLTGTLGNAVRGAVQKLKGLSEGFQTTITAVPVAELGDPQTITFDKTEANLLQMAYGVLDVVLSLPTIWTWNGLDDFIADNSQRDPVTGDWVRGRDGQPTDDISGAEFASFVRLGPDGQSTNGDEPLRSNPAGLARLNAALSDLLGAAQGVLSRIGNDSAGDPLAGHVVSMARIFTGFDDQPKVVSYAARAFAGTVGQARASLGANTTVHAYLPLATLTSFDACDAGGTNPDVAIHNAPRTGVFPATAADVSDALADTLVLSGAVGTAQVNLDDGFGEYAPGVHVVKVTVPSATHLSFYTVDAAGSTDVDTSGDLAYVDGSGNLVPWDSDTDAGPGLHFGLSVDAAYMTTTTMTTLPGAGPYTFYIAVTHPAGGDTVLHVQSNTTGAWPANAPIFLKGGTGRWFEARTYSLGALPVNAGEALKNVSQFFDLSRRDSFQFIADPNPPDPQNPGQVPSLLFRAGTLRNRIQAMLPAASFVGSVLENAGNDLIDVFNATPLDFSLGGDLLSAAPVEVGSYGSLTFCAPPFSLTPSNLITGGFQAMGF